MVHTKVFNTSGGKKSGEKGSPRPKAESRVEGTVVYCNGRPDLCGEIKNVILHKRPLGTCTLWLGE